MKKRSSLFFVIINCCLFLLCQVLLSQRQLDKKTFERIDRKIIDFMKEGDIPGLSVVLINNGETTLLSYGYSNLESKTRVQTTTLFEIGSCSKAFTALAIVDLIEKGKINLEDDISHYLPWLNLTYEENKAKVKVKHLLYHTSGIPWNTISKIPESSHPEALQQTVATLMGQELEETPGKEYEYATINYDVLALIAEKVTRIPFEKYLQDTIISKLGLTQTTMGIPVDSSKMAEGYKIGFFKPRKYSAPRFKGNNPAGYVISNAKDISKWLKFQMGLSGSNLYQLARITHQRDKSVPLHNMASYAMGWEVSLRGDDELFHSGLNPNFTSYIAFRPQEKTGIAVLANSNSTYTPLLGDHLLKLLLDEEIENEFDPDDNGDTTYSIIVIALLLYILIIIGYLFSILADLVKKRRTYEQFGIKKTIKAVIMIVTLVPFLYGLYLFPEAIISFNWQAILVWTPYSFEILTRLIPIAFAISYIVYLVSLIFPERNQYKRVAPRLLLISILSGLANVIVIIMVTSALNSDVELKYLIYYYTLTLLVYLLGRRFVQVSLIKLTRGLVFDLRVKLVDKIFSTSYQKFERIDRGRIYTLLNDDVNNIGQSTNIFVGLVTSIITTIGAFIYLASIAFWATVLTILLVLTLSGIYYYAVRSTNKYFEMARDERNVFMRLLNGMIDGFKELSLHRIKKLEYKDDITQSANRFREKISIADIRFVHAFLVGESLLVVLLGIVSFGMPELFPNMKSYTLMSFIIILLYLIGPVNGILNSVPGLLHLKVAWNRITKFLNEIPANINLAEPIKRNDPRVHTLKLKDISFFYMNQDSDETSFGIGPINLEILSGEIVFIVGGNGSGKTTLAKIITGLYAPDEGKISVNDKHVTGLELSEHFSTVFSPSYLFKKLYNINTETKKEEIKEILEILQLEKKVNIQNNEYSTIELSGGQRKRLALLQCYLENSPIYLFDEWAADQDPSYRNFFYRTLLPGMKALKKIIIVITHDDHYFDVADRILEMKDGKLKRYSPNTSIAQILSK